MGGKGEREKRGEEGKSNCSSLKSGERKTIPANIVFQGGGNCQFCHQHPKKQKSMRARRKSERQPPIPEPAAFCAQQETDAAFPRGSQVGCFAGLPLLDISFTKLLGHKSLENRNVMAQVAQWCSEHEILDVDMLKEVRMECKFVQALELEAGPCDVLMTRLADWPEQRPSF